MENGVIVGRENQCEHGDDHEMPEGQTCLRESKLIEGRLVLVKTKYNVPVLRCITLEDPAQVERLGCRER